MLFPENREKTEELVQERKCAHLFWILLPGEEGLKTGAESLKKMARYTGELFGFSFHLEKAAVIALSRKLRLAQKALTSQQSL